MTKKKISPVSPWSFGKGKSLSQSMGSGKNGDILEAIYKEINAPLPKELSGSSAYPAELVQDSLSYKAPPVTSKQAIISDMLPAVVEPKKVYTPPLTHSGVVVPDEAVFNTKPNHVMGNNYDVPAVIDTKPSHSAMAFQDDLATRTYKPNFTMNTNNLPVPFEEQIASVAPKLSPWSKMKQAAAPVMKVGNAMANSSAGKLILHPVTGAVTMALESDDANAGEDNDVMRERRNMGLDSDAPEDDFNAEATENAKRILAGIPVSNEQPFQIPSKGNIESTPMMTPPPQQPVVANNQQPVNPGNERRSIASQRGGFINANMQYPTGPQPVDERDEYAEMIKAHQAAYNKKLANSTEFGYTDFSPLANWVDGLTGGNSAQGYRAPAKADQDMVRVSGLGKQLSDYEMDKEKNKIAMLNALKERNGGDWRDKELMKHQLKMMQIAARNGNKPVKPEKDPTAAQSKAATYARRLQEVEKDFSKANFDRSNFVNSLKATILPNAAQDDDLKKQRQSELNFINALLRQESGAAIGDAEYQKAELQYFPRANDPVELQLQKKRNREIVWAGLQAEAGDKASSRLEAKLNIIQPDNTQPVVNVGNPAQPQAPSVNIFAEALAKRNSARKPQ